MKNKPKWTETFDDNDNSIWEANSPFGDDGVPFEWRIKCRLVKNRIEYYEASDLDILVNPENPRTWRTLEAAKNEINAEHSEAIKHASKR